MLSCCALSLFVACSSRFSLHLVSPPPANLQPHLDINVRHPRPSIVAVEGFHCWHSHLGGPRALHADIFIAAVVACTVGSPSRCSKQAAHFAQDSLKLNQPFSSSASFDSDLMASSSSNVVGVHYRVGKKIGEGSFGVIFEGTNLLNNQQVAIKFVRQYLCTSRELGNSSSLLCIRVRRGGFHRWLTSRPFAGTSKE